MSASRRGRKPALWTYYLGALAVFLLALSAATWLTADRLRDILSDHLRSELEGYAGIVAAGIALRPETAGEEVCLHLAVEPSIRLTLVDATGVVSCDSQADRRQMDNHRARPEIARALLGAASSITRYSRTVEADLLYVAVPVLVGDGIRYVVRTARPVSWIEGFVSRVSRTITTLVLLFVAAAAALGFYVYRKVYPPLQDITRGASRFAQGDFSLELPAYEVREIADLASALNRMAGQIERMEGIRRDFVANVSHELKTPVTSIQGFVETLREGAKDDPEDLDRFLEIVSQQSHRLAAIIEDLLTLSRLEGQPAAQLLSPTPERARGLLDSAREIVKPRADAKGIGVEIDCPGSLRVVADRSLLIHALTNLLDNAVKYSPEGTAVTLRADAAGESVRFEVVDQGPGIAEEHLPRLFERFYRVDRARSRSLGGTGLGLAIVKHVASIHGGEVSVSSESGAGSTFAIELPGPH